MIKTISTAILGAATAVSLCTAPAFAQTGNFGLELNSARAVGDGCRLTYVATNNTGSALEKTSYEVAVFDKEGVVSRLLILEFGQLQPGKTKVVQFDLADSPCEDVSRLLVNSNSECVASDGSTPNCLEGLVTSSRAEIQFGI
ncbi:hypothetical protein IV417_07625 [Alphaproteobacteria bacterium KMM 3653]|uniref:Tat pathway signal sequence domain protein n=1 Tax=Harenicola maris TaxID=2841044 RepID=A0AAP2CMY3_9RHOB|nr:hypothetical protein [Harenicola maris]